MKRKGGGFRERISSISLAIKPTEVINALEELQKL